MKRENKNHLTLQGTSVLCRYGSSLSDIEISELWEHSVLSYVHSESQGSTSKAEKYRNEQLWPNLIFGTILNGKPFKLHKKATPLRVLIFPQLRKRVQAHSMLIKMTAILTAMPTISSEHPRTKANKIDQIQQW